jgi:hypothetical protein
VKAQGYKDQEVREKLKSKGKILKSRCILRTARGVMFLYLPEDIQYL